MEYNWACAKKNMIKRPSMITGEIGVPCKECCNVQKVFVKYLPSALRDSMVFNNHLKL